MCTWAMQDVTRKFHQIFNTYEKGNIDHLILLGDFFDFWRRNNAKIITDNDDVIQKIIDLDAKNLHYIIGNHDYYMYKLGKLYGENFPFTISKNLRLEDGGKINFISPMDMNLKQFILNPLHWKCMKILVKECVSVKILLVNLQVMYGHLFMEVI
jgi:hypothetical protein